MSITQALLHHIYNKLKQEKNKFTLIIICQKITLLTTTEGEFQIKSVLTLIWFSTFLKFSYREV